MIEFHNISIGYGDRKLLDGVSASIGSGEVAALTGRNGAGKSTLLRAAGGIGGYEGRIVADGCELRTMTARQMAEKVSFVTTERVRIPDLRCRDVVAFGRAPYTDWTGRLGREDREIVARALSLTGMSDYADRTLDRMSDGECQRVMIARALAQQTPVIILDEPTSFLDIPNRREICSLLRDLAHNEGKTVLYSTHELDIALTLCDTVMLIDTPRLHSLTADAMARSGLIDRVFGIDSSDFRVRA